MATHLLDFGSNFVECGPIIKGFIIDRDGFRWREAGRVAQGIASDDARVVVGRYGQPASHHLFNFGKSLVNIIVSGRLWREDLVSAVGLGLSR